MLRGQNKNIIIFGFSANPPGDHHLYIVQKLTQLFRNVIVIPRGPDKNKPSIYETTPSQRKKMVRLAFSNIPNLEIDYRDLDNNIFTPTWAIDQKYKARFPNSEIWHAVGGDLVKGGANENSEIQKSWRKGKEIWRNLNWAVINHPAYPVDPLDLPPKNMIVKMESFSGRSTTIRDRIEANQPISDLVPPAVEKYIIKNNLYK